MSARNRVFMILALLTVGSLIFYLVTVRPTGDLQLIGTVDANEVLVSARIPGRIQTLTVKEGDPVTAGQLIAVIESDDLEAALKAAEATAASEKWKLNGSVDTDRQNSGETSSATVSAEAQVRACAGRFVASQGELRTPAGRYEPDGGTGPAGHHERADAGRTGDGAAGRASSRECGPGESVSGTGQPAPGACSRVADGGLGADRGLDTRRCCQCTGTCRRGQDSKELLRSAGAGERKGERMGGAPGRSGGHGRADRDRDGPDADLGLRSPSGDAGRRGASWATACGW